ncbi:MAG TPA: dipeptide ABC transporter ATP-binding protein [Acidimicrobiales bacterium]|nr:dipeptide ABC transporter ATP-binding protein [Acidimicrobiales bacterium]
MSGDVILRATEVVKHFPVQSSGLRRSRDVVHAVDGVSLEVHRGETLGLVGETGCGKSTLARCVARLFDLTAGTVEFDGQDISRLKPRRLGQVRREMQMIFQDPYGSLNPKRRVGSIIGDPFAIHGIASGKDRKRRVQEMMELVGLNPEHFNRFPAEFSGGQRQRIGVARALALRPKLVICDEPVSALDVSIQAQVLNLLADLQQQLNLTYIFISHDLSVVRHVSDRLMLMYLGKVVESGPSEEVYNRARHPYSNALLSAIPLPDPRAMLEREKIVLVGDVPSPISPPEACRFHPRCPKAQPRCAEEEPLLESRLGDGPRHVAACHYPVADGESLAHARPTLAAEQRVVEPEPMAERAVWGPNGAGERSQP